VLLSLVYFSPNVEALLLKIFIFDETWQIYYFLKLGNTLSVNMRQRILHDLDIYIALAIFTNKARGVA